MSNKEPGYVYILTNPSFREDWVKIGKSSRPVDVRSKELDNTAVPLPFEIFATMKTTKYNEVEKLVHKTIDRLTDLRIRQNREFFNVAPQMALDIFRDIASAIDDAEVTLYEDNKPIVESEHKEPQKREVKRPRFKFSMCGIGRQGALCGNVCMVHGQFHATEHAVVVYPNHLVDSLWFKYMLDKMNLNQYSTGRAQPGLSVQKLLDIKIRIPKDLSIQERTAKQLIQYENEIQAAKVELSECNARKQAILDKYLK